MSLRGYIKKTRHAPWTLSRPAAAPKPPKRVRSVSKRRQKVTQEYRLAAAAFLVRAIASGQTCEVVSSIPELREGRKYGHSISDKIACVHHRFGRLGKLLTWEPGFMAVSTQGHRWIHSNVLEARKRGWICEEGCWNNYKKALTAQLACA